MNPDFAALLNDAKLVSEFVVFPHFLSTELLEAIILYASRGTKMELDAYTRMYLMHLYVLIDADFDSSSIRA